MQPPKRMKLPSERTVRRYMAEFRNKPEPEQRRAEWFRWPESMEGALPWEASRTVLDLVRHYRESGLGPPLIRECVWLWRVTLAAPDMMLDQRIDIAAILAGHEASGAAYPDNLRSVEIALAYQEPPKDFKLPANVGARHLTTVFNLGNEPKGKR